MKIIFLLSALAVSLLYSCDNEDNLIIGGYDKYINYISPINKDFKTFVSNQYFKLNYNGLSNQEPVATTRYEPSPSFNNIEDFLNYCPLSFWFNDDSVYCSIALDRATYQAWEYYKSKNNVSIDLAIKSNYKYDEKSGSLSTTNKIFPGEKDGCKYLFGLSNESSPKIGVVLNKQVIGTNEQYDSIDKMYKYLYATYKQIHIDWSFNTQLKVFDTNEEAVAYAKELMAKEK